LNKVCKLEIAAVGTVGIFVIMDNNSKLIIDHVTRAMDINTSVNTTEEFRVQLVNVVEQLLQKDFPRLIHVLYRLDVDEAKLKAELKGNQSNQSTAELIADMIIERQRQKQEMRKRFGGSEHIPDEEKW